MYTLCEGGVGRTKYVFKLFYIIYYYYYYRTQAGRNLRACGYYLSFYHAPSAHVAARNRSADEPLAVGGERDTGEKGDGPVKSAHHRRGG